MSSTLRFKVYREGMLVAATLHAEEAAAVLALSGGEIRVNRKRIFQDGEALVSGEIVRADESIDRVAEVVLNRLHP